jgi:CubicO group peptidase (beta-lactamase class C family)
MGALAVQGVCNQGFGAVREAFIANFEESGEVGARVAIILDGVTEVDLWAGHTTAERDVAWSADTLVCCMSVSKGVTALAAHVLADRGLLDYDAPVAHYWPEFAANGKAEITVRDALSHRASLAIIDGAEHGDALDWDLFTSKIANQAPNWSPRSDETYHSVTYGFIVGEIVRRVDGRPIERFIHDELVGPLGADFVLGCDGDDLARVAPQIPNPDNELMNGGLVNEQTAAMFRPMPGDPDYRFAPGYLQMINPSGSGVSHALGLARMFAPLACGGEFNGHRLLSPTTIAAACEEQWHHPDSLFGNDFRVTLGLLLHIPFNYFGREGNVGSAGAGGYTVFADPERHLSFAYTPNRYTTGFGLGDESRRLIDSLYDCV